MSIELWAAFVAACVAVLAVPGPTVMLVVSYALGNGKASGWATVPGVALGDVTAMTVSLLGAGAVLAASAALFTVLKLAGAVYLVWLGIRLWRSTGRLADPGSAGRGRSSAGMFRDAYLVTALNPKSIVFFVAFVPQFIDPALPALKQFVILEATFVTLAALTVALWAALAGRMRAHFMRPAAQRLVNRMGACFLVGAGLFTVFLRRQAAG